MAAPPSQEVLTMRARLHPLTTLLLAALASFALADDAAEEPTVIHAAEGITITKVVLNGDGRGEAVPPVILPEVFLNAQNVDAEIPLGGATATLSVTAASKLTGAVVVETSSDDLVLRGDSRVTLRAGDRRTFSFTAFAPHAGTITFRNDAGDVLAVVPYTVSMQSPFRQRVNVSLNDSLDLSGSYGVSFRDSGLSVSVNVRWNIPDGRVRGSVSGSYSW